MNILLKEFLLKTTRIIPDGLYLRIAYRMVTGKSLHLNPPITYNEKLQWLKLNNRMDEYTSMVDKYEVRKFIEERVGEGYYFFCSVPTLIHLYLVGVCLLFLSFFLATDDVAVQPVADIVGKAVILIVELLYPCP